MACVSVCLTAAAGATAPLQSRPELLTTPWTGGVSTTHPLPEYPRPQLQRRDWENLNGRWQYGPYTAHSGVPFGQNLPETILVPYSVRSPLSGIERGDTAGYYRRAFTVPRGWNSRHVLLNFGAVSWEAAVWVNRQLVGVHRGDYGGFSLDVTSALHRNGVNELVVAYVNPIGAAGEPVGKQAVTPGGIQHSANSGIWQTVWLEPVAPAHITGLQLTPDVAHQRLAVSATVTGSGPLRLSLQGLAGSRVVASAQGSARRTILLSIPKARLWWPWSPYLYGLQVTLSRGRTQLDHVTSYFGMRSITLGRIGGARRILINGRFVFQSGALDQGYWPDGLYTPPTDAAMRFDIASAHRLGYNMLREHGKVQPDRWYLWADRLGMLVWQDMPSMSLVTPHPPTQAARAEFRRELTEVVTERRSHPSIVTWIPFNEGWQQFDLNGVTEQVKRLDRAALVDGQSGSANCCDAREPSASDIRDTHLYTGPFAVPGDGRATAIGEYGGVVPVSPAGHSWPGTPFSVGNPAAAWPLSYVAGVIKRQYAMLGVEMRTEGLSASIFTEFGAYEQETGLLAYDRRVFNINPGFMSTLNRRLIADSLNVGSRRAAKPKIPGGTLGRWPMTEGHGGQASSTSGMGYPLVLTPGTVWTRGRAGAAALAMGGRIAAAYATAPIIDTTRSFTVSAWLRSDAVGQSGTAISQPGTEGSSFSLGIETDRGSQPNSREGAASSQIPAPALRTRWTFDVPDAPTCLAVNCGVRANMRYDDGRLSVRPGAWHFVTGIFDRPTGTISIYVDGEPQDVEHVDAMPRSTGPLTIGAGIGVYGSFDAMRGLINGLRVYQRPLTPDEVWELYRAGG